MSLLMDVCGRTAAHAVNMYGPWIRAIVVHYPQTHVALNVFNIFPHPLDDFLMTSPEASALSWSLVISRSQAQVWPRYVRDSLATHG